MNSNSNSTAKISLNSSSYMSHQSIVYPQWFKNKKLKQKRTFNFLILSLALLLLIHLFFIRGKQNKLTIAQENLANQLEVNNKKLMSNSGLNSKLNLLQDTLSKAKIFFTEQNTQIIIESLGDLLKVSGAQSSEISLLNQSNNINSAIIQEKNKSNPTFGKPIQIQMQFRANLTEQQKIINQINSSDYLFSIATISQQILLSNSQNNSTQHSSGLSELGSFKQKNENQTKLNKPKVTFKIIIPTRKIDDINAKNLKSLSKKGIFSAIKNLAGVPQKIKKVTISSYSNASCKLPSLEGIIYKKEKQKSLIFISGEIYKLKQKVNCYVLFDIFPNRILLLDKNGKIFELFTQ